MEKLDIQAIIDWVKENWDAIVAFITKFYNDVEAL